MDKLKTSALGGFPFVLDDIRQLLGRLTSPANHGIYQAFNNILGGFGTDFIVQGCVVSGSTGAFSITEGWILLSGELIKVDAQGPFDEAVNGTFTKVTTFDSRGNKEFLNGSIADTYEKNRGVISGVAGTLAFDGNTLLELTSGAETLPDIGRVEIKKKIIEIGDWNMDADSGVSVTHELSDFKKIRSVDVIIRRDGDVIYSDLGIVEVDGTLGGGWIILNSTDITLTRVAGGFYDAAVYDDTSFNRGFINIEFEA